MPQVLHALNPAASPSGDALTHHSEETFLSFQKKSLHFSAIMTGAYRGRSLELNTNETLVQNVTALQANLARTKGHTQ